MLIVRLRLWFVFSITRISLKRGSVHFTVILAGLKKIVPYAENFVI